MIFLLFSALLGSAALVFYEASKQLYFGTPWAADVCSASQLFCRHPEWLAYGAGGMIALFLAWKVAGNVQ
jgi:hypothetical protein